MWRCLILGIRSLLLGIRKLRSPPLVGFLRNRRLLDVQAKEGLTLGLAITVRYRLDAKRLDYIQEQFAASGGKRDRASDGG